MQGRRLLRPIGARQAAPQWQGVLYFVAEVISLSVSGCNVGKTKERIQPEPAMMDRNRSGDYEANSHTQRSLFSFIPRFAICLSFLMDLSVAYWYRFIIMNNY
jgi:hypothetical protein